MKIVYVKGRKLQAGDCLRVGAHQRKLIGNAHPIFADTANELCVGYFVGAEWTEDDGADVFGPLEVEPHTLYRVERDS